MKNYNESVEINQNPGWIHIPNRTSSILIIGGSGSDKTDVLLNLIKHQQPNIEKKYLCVKDTFESKHKLFINGG